MTSLDPIDSRPARVRALPHYGSFMVYPSIHLSICLPACLSVYLSLSTYPPVHLSFCPSIHLSIYLSICISIYLSIYLSNNLHMLIMLFREYEVAKVYTTFECSSYSSSVSRTRHKDEQIVWRQPHHHNRQCTFLNLLSACPATGQILGVSVGSRLLLRTGFHVPSPRLPEVAHAESTLKVLELLWKWCGVKNLSGEGCFSHYILHMYTHVHAYATRVCVCVYLRVCVCECDCVCVCLRAGSSLLATMTTCD